MEYAGFRDLRVYQLSFQLALDVFDISKLFPKEEKYSPADHMRRSSSALSALIADVWTHRKHPKFCH